MDDTEPASVKIMRADQDREERARTAFERLVVALDEQDDLPFSDEARQALRELREALPDYWA